MYFENFKFLSLDKRSPSITPEIIIFLGNGWAFMVFRFSVCLDIEVQFKTAISKNGHAGTGAVRLPGNQVFFVG